METLKKKVDSLEETLSSKNKQITDLSKDLEDWKSLSEYATISKETFMKEKKTMMAEIQLKKLTNLVHEYDNKFSRINPAHPFANPKQRISIGLIVWACIRNP